MYGKLLNRFRRGCQPLSNNTCSVRPPSKSIFSASTTDTKIYKDENLLFQVISPKKQLLYSCLKFKYQPWVREHKKQGYNRPGSSEKHQPFPFVRFSSATKQFWSDLVHKEQHKNWSNIKNDSWKNVGEREAMLRNKICDILKLRRNSLQRVEIMKATGVNEWLTHEEILEINKILYKEQLLLRWKNMHSRLETHETKYLKNKLSESKKISHSTPRFIAPRSSAVAFHHLLCLSQLASVYQSQGTQAPLIHRATPTATFPFGRFIHTNSSRTHLYSIESKAAKRKPEASTETADETCAKRKQSGSSRRGKGDNKNQIPRELMMIPEKTSGTGGGWNSPYRVQLQTYLNKQPQNSGATFKSQKGSDEKYHCTVTFQSNFALSSSQPSPTQEEAEQRAALEANKWIIGSDATTDLESAKVWFDAYSMQVVGSVPSYTSFRAASDLYVTDLHLVNNKLFLFTDSIDAHKLFLEANCKTLNPDINVEQMAIKTALHGTAVTLEPKQYNRETLNHFCLHNGGTIPVLHTASFQDPKSGKMSWSCSLKSFARDYLCQAVNFPSDKENEKVSSESDSFTFSPSFADFLNAQSSHPQRSPILAEDNAASVLLEKLGLSPKQLIALRGRCKNELEFYARDMDLSATYHTEQINSKNVDGSPMYDCVVSSLCLHDTRQTFTVTSEGGFNESDEACESAAKNALLLLGQNIS